MTDMVHSRENNGDLRRVIAILDEAQRGVTSSRLEDLPEDETLAALYRAVNGTIEALDREKKRSAAQRNEVEDLLAMVEIQRATILEISNPVIEVADGVLCLPVIGSIDDAQGNTILDTLLATVVERRAREVILDVTGVRTMGAATGQWLTRVAGAVRLLGAECTVTGIQPELATLLAHSSLDLLGVTTIARVRDALERGRARERAKARPASGVRKSR